MSNKNLQKKYYCTYLIKTKQNTVFRQEYMKSTYIYKYHTSDKIFHNKQSWTNRSNPFPLHSSVIHPCQIQLPYTSISCLRQTLSSQSTLPVSFTKLQLKHYKYTETAQTQQCMFIHPAYTVYAQLLGIPVIESVARTTSATVSLKMRRGKVLAVKPGELSSNVSDQQMEIPTESVRSSRRERIDKVS